MVLAHQASEMGLAGETIGILGPAPCILLPLPWLLSLADSDPDV